MKDFNIDFFKIITDFYPNSNFLSVKRYIKFCERFNNVGDNLQKHHLLPKSRFKDYKNSNVNIYRLSVRAHFIAHVLYTKATNDLFEAVSFMTRFNKVEFFNSRLYEIAYNQGIEKIRNKNSGENNPMFGNGYKISGKKNGRYRDNYRGDLSEISKKISKRNKGYTVVIRDGESLRIKIEERLPSDKTPFDGIIKVRDEHNNLIIFNNKEDYNKSGLKFHTTGKTLVYERKTLEKVYVDSSEYQNNKHLYYHMNSKVLRERLKELNNV